MIECIVCGLLLDNKELDSENWNGETVTCDCGLSKGESDLLAGVGK